MMKLLIYGDPSGLHSLYAIKQQGHVPEDIVVWEDDPRHQYAIKQISDRIHIVSDLNLLESMHFLWNIGNPPYLKNLHLEFLIQGLNCSDNVSLTHPSGWLFRNGQKIEQKAKLLLKNRVKSITLYNGNSVFKGAEFDCPLTITKAAKSYEGPIELIYKSSGNKYYVNDLSEMPTGFWEPNDTHLSIVDRYKQLTKSSCIGDLAGKYTGSSFVQSPRTCGHAVHKDPAKFCTDDFFTFFYRNSDIWTLKPKEPCYNVNNNEQAKSLVSYMKTKFARFGLSIHKISRDCYLSRYLSNVPLPPLDRQWTEQSIMDYYKIPTDQVDYINSFIPDYYE
jgi:hypothetical protein